MAAEALKAGGKVATEGMKKGGKLAAKGIKKGGKVVAKVLKKSYIKKWKCGKCGKEGRGEVDQCPSCGSTDIKQGYKATAIGILIKFGVYFGIIFASLSIVFGSFLSLLNTYIGQFIPPYVIVLLISLGVGYVLTKKGLVVGIIYCVVLVFVLGIGAPLIAGISPILGGEITILGGGGLDIGCWFSKLFSDPQSIQECYITVEQPPTYTGTKSYESLSIIFGEKVLGEYVIPTVYASKEEEPEPYSLPFYVKNLNSGGGGLKISGVTVDYVEAEEKEGGINDTFYFEALTIEPKTMDLEPEEEIIVYAENFTSKDGTYVNRFPCEEKKLKELDFETRLRYTQNVTHKRTLSVVRSREDESLLSGDPDIRRQVYSIETPSDGPVDLIVSFTTPYIMGTRSEDKVRMTVWVENKESGKMKFISNKNITIKAIGGLPSWIELIESAKCKEIGENIEIYTGRYVGYDFREGMKKQFICDFKIANYPTGSAYQLINFEGRLEYEYIEIESFSEEVDRSTFC